MGLGHPGYAFVAALLLLGCGPRPPATTCATGVLAPQPSPQNTRKSALMAPGEACAACHLGQNFQDQNPGGALGQRPDLAYDVMGTVYTAEHEQDLCVSAAGDAGLVVEITDGNGAVAIRASVNAAGNFYGSADGGLVKPFSARVIAPGGASRAMDTRQATGDCNTCHTEQGLMSAPGRILAP